MHPSLAAGSIYAAAAGYRSSSLVYLRIHTFILHFLTVAVMDLEQVRDSGLEPVVGLSPVCCLGLALR